MKALKWIVSLIMVTGLLLGSGCNSTGAAQFDANRAYSDFVQQQRTYSAMSLRTTPTSRITIEGEIELVMDAPLNPLSARASDPSTSQAGIAAAERMVKALALGYFGYRAVDSLSASRDPVVVEQPAPVIVQPTVIGP
jgi:hypothetical protein